MLQKYNFTTIAEPSRLCTCYILKKLFSNLKYFSSSAASNPPISSSRTHSSTIMSRRNSTEVNSKKEDKPKLKILALHGYRQSGASFRAKIGSFRKAVSQYATLSFVTAPHYVRDDAGGSGGGDSYGWWFNAEDNTFSGKCLGGPAIGFEETLRQIESTVKEHGPFHGFMGFSQGACLVGLLAAMQQKGYLRYSFKFAIFASGFCSGSLVHKGFYDEEINLPSLHVYGESDSIIPKEMSEALINTFVSPAVAEHSGGHYVACSGAVRDSYLDFLHERRQDMLEELDEAADTNHL